MITRVGVVTDTHVGEHLPALPAEVLEALAGVDLVLHAGDLTDLTVLDELRRLAPVVAVRGNHDERARLEGLPRDVLVRVGGARIGLTHGHRSAAIELPAAALSLVSGRPRLMHFERAVRRRFGDVDCVVTGHLHMPVHRVVRRGAGLLARRGLRARAGPRLRLGRRALARLPPLPRAPARRRARPRGRGAGDRPRAGSPPSASRCAGRSSPPCADQAGRVTMPSATYQSIVRRSASSMGV